jgi:hypothetical protein
MKLKACKFCGNFCMEEEWVEDWFTGKDVVRFTAMCNESDNRDHSNFIKHKDSKSNVMVGWSTDKDEIRTEFLPEKEAIQEWNDLFSIASKNKDKRKSLVKKSQQRRKVIDFMKN